MAGTFLRLVRRIRRYVDPVGLGFRLSFVGLFVGLVFVSLVFSRWAWHGDRRAARPSSVDNVKLHRRNHLPSAGYGHPATDVRRANTVDAPDKEDAQGAEVPTLGSRRLLPPHNESRPRPKVGAAR